MKVKGLERVIFTPGLCRQSLTSDYYEMENTVVVGTTGSGKTTLMQAIAKSIIDSNDACNFNMAFFDLYGYNYNPICNSNRILPCMDIMHFLFGPEFEGLSYEQKVEQFIAHLPLMAKWEMPDVYDTEASPEERGFLVVMIDGFDRLDKFYQDAVFATMKLSNKIKFIIGVQSSVTVREYLDEIPYRIVTKSITPGDSDIVLGCNLGYTQADDYGTCWFKDERNPYIYKKYSIECIPNSLLNKMMKVYSGYAKGLNISRRAFRDSVTNYVRNVGFIKMLLKDDCAQLDDFVYYVLNSKEV